MGRLCLAFLLLLATSDSDAYDRLKTIFSWKALEFAFPHSHAREMAIANGSFKPGKPVPIDVDVYNKGEHQTVFISVPRIESGVPVTLGYVTNYVSPEGNPIIAPYPDWPYNTVGSCNSFVSVFRVQIDECDRLWVLDSGKIGEKTYCPPQLHVFSLQTNKLIMRYAFPRNQYKEDSLFVTVAIDVRGTIKSCRDTFAYVADVTGFGLLVYDHSNHRSWRIENNLFYPYPPYGTYHINGETFDLMDGILGLALSPLKPNGDRILYFHSLASRVESSVPTSVIRNFTLFHEVKEASPRSFVPFANERRSQSAAQAMDRNGVLFFGLLSDLAIGCWNSKDYPEYGGPNNEIVITNRETLQFPSGLKIITTKDGKQEMWTLTASFQKFMTGTLNSSETNFRILADFVDNLVRGTKCDTESLHLNGGKHRRQNNHYHGYK